MSAWGSTIEVRLDLPDGSECAADLIALEGRDLELALSADGARLSLTTRVGLRFTGEGLTNEFCIEARVLGREEVDGERHYQLLLEGDIESQLKRSLRRRDAFRVAPDPQDSFPARLTAVDGPGSKAAFREEAELMNISLLGLSLRISPELEEALAEVDAVRIDMQLPDAETPIAIHGHLVSRRMKAGAVLLGVEIAGMESSGATDVEEQLTKFVVRRQMRELRDN